MYHDDGLFNDCSCILCGCSHFLHLPCCIFYDWQIIFTTTAPSWPYIIHTNWTLQDEAALVNHRYEKYRALGTYSILTDENERLAVIEVRVLQFPPHNLIFIIVLLCLLFVRNINDEYLIISCTSFPFSFPLLHLQEARSKKGDTKRPPRVDLSPSLLVKHLAEEVCPVISVSPSVPLFILFLFSLCLCPS